MKDTPLLMCGDMVRATLEDRKTQTRRVVTDPKLITLFNYIGGEAPEDANRLSVSFLRDVERTDETKTWRYTGLVVYSDEYPEEGAEEFTCPYGVPGDRLWVKETHWRFGRWSRVPHRKTGKPCWKFKGLWHPLGTQFSQPDYHVPTPPKGLRAYRYQPRWHKRPAIFLRRQDSRITLEIINIRVERVRDITEEDCYAEGIPKLPFYQRLDADCRRSRMDRLSGTKGEPHGVAEYHKLWDSLNKERGFGWDTNPWVWVLTFKRI